MVSCVVINPKASVILHLHPQSCGKRNGLLLSNPAQRVNWKCEKMNKTTTKETEHTYIFIYSLFVRLYCWWPMRLGTICLWHNHRGVESGSAAHKRLKCDCGSLLPCLFFCNFFVSIWISCLLIYYGNIFIINRRKCQVEMVTNPTKSQMLSANPKEGVCVDVCYFIDFCIVCTTSV